MRAKGEKSHRSNDSTQPKLDDDTCDTTPSLASIREEYEEDVTAARNFGEHIKEQPNSYWWRLRMYQPCKDDHDRYEWDLSGIRLYRETCAEAKTPLFINRTASSGEADVQRTSGSITYGGLNKQLAFDSDATTNWRGTADEVGLVWIMVVLGESEKVRCVKFVQCDCLRSARFVALDYNQEYNDLWTPVSITGNIAKGEWSAVEVKEVDTRNHAQKAGDSIAGQAKKVGDAIAHGGSTVVHWIAR